MARTAKRTLLEAALVTRVGEDVLTEMLAHVLATDDEVAATLAEKIGPSGKWRADQVSTQDSTDAGRVDLTATLVLGGERRLLWVEVKAGAEEQPKQLERYADELGRRQGPGTLVALAEAGDPILSHARDHGLAVPLTWQEVLDACGEVAETRGGREWREQARSPDALACQRTLAEFCWYLEHRSVAVNVEAMSEEDVVAACRAERLLVDEGSIDQLLAAASTGIPGFRLEESYRTPATPGRILALERGVTLKADLPGGLWPLRQEEAWPELWFNTTGTRDLDDEVEEEPAFFAGFSFDVSRAPHVTDALTDPDWVGKPDGVLLGRGDPYVWIVRMKTLRELANAGGSFSEQSDTLRAWCEESLRLIGEAQPPPKWPTSPSGSADRPPD